jgi:hypothetical protein
LLFLLHTTIGDTTPTKNGEAKKYITVQTIVRLEEIRRRKLHLFPGTVAHYIIESDTISGEI